MGILQIKVEEELKQNQGTPEAGDSRQTRSVSTGLSRAARIAGMTLAPVATKSAPTSIQKTVRGSTIAGTLENM